MSGIFGIFHIELDENSLVAASFLIDSDKSKTQGIVAAGIIMIKFLIWMRRL